MPNDTTGKPPCPRCKGVPDGRHVLLRKWICWNCHIMYGHFIGTRIKAKKRNRLWKDRGVPDPISRRNGTNYHGISLDFESEADKIARFWQLVE